MENSAIIDAVVSHALTLGVFSSVNKHEPKSAPENGYVAGMWVQSLGTSSRHSGLAVSGVRIVYRFRIYGRMLQEPQDEIDPGLVEATDLFLNSLHGDFQLDDLVTAVDLLGQSGSAMAGQAGYIKLGDGLYRVMDIDIPVIIADAWEQVP
jgi:hypothetical protein